MNDSQIEKEIQEKGLTAPRVTPARIEEVIDSEHYFTALDGVDGYYRGGPEAQAVKNANTLGLLTFCVLVLKNGFTVTGESACASPENFDAEIGRKIARENAKQKIWALEGYALKQKLHDKKVSYDCMQALQVLADNAKPLPEPAAKHKFKPLSDSDIAKHFHGPILNLGTAIAFARAVLDEASKEEN